MGPETQDWHEIITPFLAFFGTMLAGYSIWRLGWDLYGQWVKKIRWPAVAVISGPARKLTLLWIFLAGALLNLGIMRFSEPVTRALGNVLWSILLLSFSWG